MSDRDEFIRRAKLVYESTKDLSDLDEIKKQCDDLLCDWVKERELTIESRGTYFSDAKFNKMFASVPLVQDKNAELVPKYDKDGNVKGHILKHCALIKCGLTREEWEIRNSTSRVTDRIEDGGQEVDPDDYLKVATQLIQSDNVHEITAGLIAVTGRRPHEILWRGDFSLIRGENYQLMFSGQGKKRGELPKFQIASLLPAKYVKERLYFLRQHDNLTAVFKEIETEFPDDREAQNRKLDSRRGRSVRRVVESYFGDKYTDKPALNLRKNEDQNNCKALRAAYGCLATERDCKGSIGSKMLHFAKLEGHYIADNDPNKDKKLKNLVTTLGYSDYFTTKPVPFPTIETSKTMQTTIKCNSETRDAINKLCKVFGNISQAQTIEKLIEMYQKSCTENNEKFCELEGNYQELVKINIANNEVIKNQELEIKKLQELVNALKLQIEETAMIKEQPTQATNNADLEALEARFEARFHQLEELIKNQINQSPVTSQELPVTSSQSTITSSQSAARDKNQQELELMSNADLWKSRKTGVAEEKVRRCFVAVCDYNNEVATGDNDRVAITNIVLRQLSGVNGQVVGAWMDSHKDEILQHNNKFGMGNQKDTNNLYTVFNRGKDVDKYLEVVKKSLIPTVPTPATPTPPTP